VTVASADNDLGLEVMAMLAGPPGYTCFAWGCVDIGTPRMLGVETPDGGGHAEWSLSIPGSLPDGADAVFQAVGRDDLGDVSISNSVARVVGDVSVPVEDCDVADAVHDESLLTLSCGAGGDIGQGFVPSGDELSRVSTQLAWGGSFPAAGVDIELKVHQGDYFGPEIGSTTVHVPEGASSLVDFVFEPPLPLVPGDVYVLRMPVENPAEYTWMATTGNTYPDGSWYGCTGVPSDAYDSHFITYTCEGGGPPASSLIGTITWPFAVVNRPSLPDPMEIKSYYNGFYNDPPCDNANTTLESLWVDQDSSAQRTYLPGEPGFDGFADCIRTAPTSGWH